jgi:hypothetical protein
MHAFPRSREDRSGRGACFDARRVGSGGKSLGAVGGRGGTPRDSSLDRGCFGNRWVIAGGLRRQARSITTREQVGVERRSDSREGNTLKGESSVVAARNKAAKPERA